MGYCKIIFGILVIVISIVISYLSTLGGPIFEVSNEHRKDAYWGEDFKDPPLKEDTSIRPFKISVPDEVLIDLKERLKRTRYVESLQGSAFEYGFNSNELRRIVDYWLNKYNWRKHEAELNKLQHFKTKIEGLDIHFVHVKGAGKKKTPLIMVHGFPGSFLEYVETIPFLSDQFEIVIPSLPGYGFSEASYRTGLNGYHIARIFVKLMKRLGHSKFLYHGGDWGAMIGKHLATTFPEVLIGFHTTGVAFPATPKFIGRAIVAELGFPELVYDKYEDLEKLHPLKDFIMWAIKEGGYLHIQATKPDTVGVGLTNSPAGLAAYILEKFSTWTNKRNVEKYDGGLEGSPYGKDKLLTNVMIYWINANIISAQRLYKEHFLHIFSDRYGVTVPTGVMVAKYEVVRYPKVVIQEFFTNVTQYIECNGGHFLAFEDPKLVSSYIKTFANGLGVK